MTMNKCYHLFKVMIFLRVIVWEHTQKRQRSHRYVKLRCLFRSTSCLVYLIEIWQLIVCRFLLIPWTLTVDHGRALDDD